MRILYTLLLSSLSVLSSTVSCVQYQNITNTTTLVHHQGFNYGSTFNNNTNKYQADFQSDFTIARDLTTNINYTSARLYTMIQAGSQNDPIQAIPAAIATNTSLLLGLWASAGDSAFQNELTALDKALQQYGQSLTNLTVGVSVGSEDLYRETPTGIENKSGAGASPDTLVRYIQQVRDILQQYNHSNILVGHVDTWTAWVNSSNNAVINAVDFVGMDGYVNIT